MPIVDPHFTMPGQDMPPQEFKDLKTQQGQINWLAQAFMKLNNVDISNSNKEDTRNPIFFGADPTGETDSTAAVNACISANRGGTIFFTPGKYKITSTINLPFNQSEKISIIGNHARLIYTGTIQNAVYIGTDRTDFNVNNAGKTSSYIQGIIIDCTGATVENGIYIANGFKDAKILSCEVHGALNGIKIGENSDKVPADAFIFNCQLYGKSMYQETVGIFSNCTDNNILMCRIYGFQKGFEINGYATIVQTHVLARFGNGETYNETYYKESMFADVNAPCKIIASYCDTLFTFLKINTTSRVILDSSFYYSASSTFPCRIIDIDVSQPNIVICNNNFDCTQPTDEQTEVSGIYFSTITALNDFATTKIELEGNILTKYKMLEIYDMMRSQTHCDPKNSVTMDTSTWYVIGCICNAGTPGELNEKAIRISGSGTITDLYYPSNATGTTPSTITVDVHINNYFDYGLQPIAIGNSGQYAMLICAKAKSNRSSKLRVFNVSGSPNKLMNTFTLGQPKGSLETDAMKTLESIAGVTQPTRTVVPEVTV